MFFFFQAEDGIRDSSVTGVQTCALPICWNPRVSSGAAKRSDERPLRAKAQGFQPAAPFHAVLGRIQQEAAIRVACQTCGNQGAGYRAIPRHQRPHVFGMKPVPAKQETRYLAAGKKSILGRALVETAKDGAAACPQNLAV